MKSITLSVLMILLGLTTFVLPASAHTSMVEGTPGDGETMNETVSDVTITFNTTVEEGSTLSIEDSSGTITEPESVEVSGEQLKASFASPLSNGNYTVNWEIIGADGHLIENQYSFTIEGVVEEVAKESEEETVMEEPVEEKEEQKESAEEVESLEEPAEPGTDSSPVMYGIMIFLALTGVGTATWTFFGKKK
ncbi:copper resistance protein CopC [Halobacillus fulvus]|nr:copper resistance protein CopC [Halobacillus fulvus]